MGSKTFKGGVHPYEGKELAKNSQYFFPIYVIMYVKAKVSMEQKHTLMLACSGWFCSM